MSICCLQKSGVNMDMMCTKAYRSALDSQSPTMHLRAEGTAHLPLYDSSVYSGCRARLDAPTVAVVDRDSDGHNKRDHHLGLYPCAERRSSSGPDTLSPCLYRHR
jgi:hypothetical protein